MSTSLDEILADLMDRVDDLERSSLAPLLRVDDVARVLALDPRTVRRLTAKGDLPSVRIGGSVRWTAKDVQAMIAASRSGNREATS